MSVANALDTFRDRTTSLTSTETATTAEAPTAGVRQRQLSGTVTLPVVGEVPKLAAIGAGLVLVVLLLVVAKGRSEGPGAGTPSVTIT